MSMYRQVATCINDGLVLKKTLESMGFKPTYSTIARQLEGYQGDLRKQTAEVIIPRVQVGNASNDIGFKKQKDGTFKAIISDYDGSRYGKEWLDKVEGKYLEMKARSTAEGLNVEQVGQREVLPDGKIRLQYAPRKVQCLSR